MNKRFEYLLIIVLSIIVSFVSTYLHHPQTPILLGNWGLKYNDVVYGVFYPRFSIDKNTIDNWYTVEKYYKLINGVRVDPLPYIDYHFEYPPIIGLLWIISTMMAINLVLPPNYTLVYYVDHLNDLASIHYMIHSIVLSIALLMNSLLIYRITREKQGLKPVILYLLLPSTILYLTYNWDTLCALFTLLGIYMLYREKYLLSGVFFGLAVSTKILPFMVVVIIFSWIITRFWEKFITWYDIVRFLIGAISTGFIPFTILYVVSPRGFHDFIAHHSRWYCENCIYQLIEHDIFSSMHQLYAILSLSIVLSTTMYLVKKRTHYSVDDLFILGFIGMLSTTLLNYVFSPQMMLLITPLAVIVLMDRIKLSLYISADTLNSLIMITFFKDREFRELLSNLGIPVETNVFNPWTLSSPVQWIAMARNILLLLILIVVFYELFKRRELE